MTRNYPYHVVEESPWPLSTSISIYILASSLIMKFNAVGKSEYMIGIGMILIMWSSRLWWKDVIREGSYMGKHTEKVRKGIRIGVILFYVSECCLFASLFWAYLHSSLSPSVELGSIWPPTGIISIETFGIPLLNLVILLSSGATVTYAHEAFIEGKRRNAKIGIMITVLLGLIFLVLLELEFSLCTFNISDTVFGSAFFILTSCHGIHVIIGSSFLLISGLRLHQLTEEHNLGLEVSIWYWHIVDIIFLLVFIIVYWWGMIPI